MDDKINTQILNIFNNIYYPYTEYASGVHPHSDGVAHQAFCYLKIYLLRRQNE